MYVHHMSRIIQPSNVWLDPSEKDEMNYCWCIIRSDDSKWMNPWGYQKNKKLSSSVQHIRVYTNKLLSPSTNPFIELFNAAMHEHHKQHSPQHQQSMKFSSAFRCRINYKILFHFEQIVQKLLKTIRALITYFIFSLLTIYFGNFHIWTYCISIAK